jgi:hypothetical protein
MGGKGMPDARNEKEIFLPDKKRYDVNQMASSRGKQYEIHNCTI